MTKFNLEKALSGAKVITRDGREVTEIHELKTLTDNDNVIAVIEGMSIRHFYKDGKMYECSESSSDLFMAPEKHEVWIAVFKDGDGGFKYSTYDTEEEAESFAFQTRLTCFKAEFEL